MNEVNLFGNITIKPEVKKNKNGITFSFFNIACHKSIKKIDNKGEVTYEDGVNFIPCILYGEKAENFCKNVIKGQKILINGEYLSFKETKADGNIEYGHLINVRRYEYGQLPKKNPIVEAVENNEHNLIDKIVN